MTPLLEDFCCLNHVGDVDEVELVVLRGVNVLCLSIRPAPSSYKHLLQEANTHTNSNFLDPSPLADHKPSLKFGILASSVAAQRCRNTGVEICN